MKNKPETPKVTLKKLTLENFKNFQKAELELGPFTVLVGANATGKSNLREAFRFLHGIGRGYTLPEIIGGRLNDSGTRVWSGMRGGLQELGYLTNYEGRGGEIYYEPMWNFSLVALFDINLKDHEILVKYHIKISLYEFGNMQIPVVLEEEIIAGEERLFHFDFEALGTILTYQLPDKIPVSVYCDEGPLTKPLLTEINENHWLFKDLRGHEKSIERVDILSGMITDSLKSMRFQDFRADLMRQAAFPGQSVLTESGDNLSSVLYTICQIPESKAALLLRLEELTPTEVVDLDFFTDEVGQVRVQLVEKNGRKISVFSASDGTLRLLGTLAALLAPQPANLYFFEELENGIHPTRLHLLTHFIENRVAQSTTQVILTTHSPHLLNFLSPETLENSSLIYRLENEPDAHIKRVMDIPYARELIEKQGIMSLHESGWFETVMSVTNEEETPEPEVAP